MALDNIPTLGPGGFNGNLDKVLVHKNGGSEVACSLLTLTNSALNIAGVYVDAVNQRVGIGTNAPSGTLSVRGADTTYGSASIKIQNSLGTSHFEVRNSGLVSILDGTIELTTAVSSIVTTATTIGAFGSLGARLGIKGSGSTSATTSLLVQNSAGTEAFRVRDDLATIFSGNSFFNGFSQTFSGGITFIDSGQFYRNGAISMQCVSGVGNNNSVVINETPNTSLASCAILIATSTTKGFLPPRMTTTQKNLIASPAAGLMVYDTDLNRPCFYSGSAWVTL